ncbi:hypothetical protein [Streptomyces sp. NPDC127033]|uniref:hypothetical protein n=1 Tax=Streptomyces sp. NPDC127033 TaxID=3347110 RepID=UPI0036678985
MASAGYGKRSATGQPASSANDFALLPGREAAIAGFIDRLPDGADISVKALAKVMAYGQCALRTALNFLEQAGHLFRRRELVVGAAGGRWVTRTWFSRAARDGDAWSACVDAGEPAPVTAPATAPVTLAARGPAQSRGYAVLASVGRRAPALSLSAADCAELEALAAEWFARGAGEQDVLRALTDGLPAPVHYPAGFVRSRLEAKLPPELMDAPVAPGPVVAVLECENCRAPARPEALVDGECGACRGAPGSVRPGGAALPPDRVRERAAEARAAALGRTVTARMP